MNNNEITNALENEERKITIILFNKVTGTTLPDVDCYPENTLKQLFDEYYENLGVDKSSSKINYRNKRTGELTTDGSMSVKAFHLEEGDTLMITDDSTVG